MAKTELLKAVQLTESGSKPTRRVHLSPDFLKTSKLAAGDFVVIRPALANTASALSITSESKATPCFAVAQAWPSFSAEQQTAHVPSVIFDELASDLSPGDLVDILPLMKSGLQGAQITKITLVPTLANTNTKEAANQKASDRILHAYLKQMLVDTKCLAQGQRVLVLFNGQRVSYTVQDIQFDDARQDADIGLMTSDSLVSVSVKVDSFKVSPKHQALLPDPKAYSRIGGLTTQIQQIREMVELPLTRPEIYHHFGLSPPRGILLHGPPGTGKTLLAASIASSLGIPKFSIAGASLSSPFHGETESALRDIFRSAIEQGPSLIIIDEVDALAPKREDSGEVERRVVAELLTLMDGLDSKVTRAANTDVASDTGGTEQDKPRVLVIACTNRPNAIDPALRRPGRFDKEIEIGIPDVDSRSSILNVLFASTPHTLSPAFISNIAARTHGFVGADLTALVQSAGLNAIRRSLAAQAEISAMSVTEDDIEAALLVTRPSAMREVFVEVPAVKWTDIGGQDEVKNKLRQAVEWPIFRKDTFKRLGIRPPGGVLLYGPPGCSKTLIAKAIATESRLNFMAIKGPEIFSKYVGESERTIRELFRKARANAPSVLFLDEIDAIGGSRADDGVNQGDRVLTTLLTEMDGIEAMQGVVILGATNRPWAMDSALLRPGRFDNLLYVPPPDVPSRESIFRINLSKMSVQEGVDIAALAMDAAGCSGAEIAAICQEAGLMSMTEALDAPHVKTEHLHASAKAMRRRITSAMLSQFEQWRDSLHS